MKRDKKNRPFVFQKKTIVLLIGAVIVCGFTGLSLFLGIYGSRDNATYTEDFVIVLGANAEIDETTSMIEKRLDAAIAYQQKNSDCIILFASAMGSPNKLLKEDPMSSPTDAMHNYFVDSGGQLYYSIEEKYATSTEKGLTDAISMMENLEYKPELLQLETAPKSNSAVIITSSFNVYRAEQIMRQQGITATHIGTAIPWYSTVQYYLREDIEVLQLWAKEMLPDSDRDPPKNYADRIARIVGMQKNAIALQKILGKDSIIPELYQSYEVNMLAGMTKRDAFFGAKDGVVKQEALYQAAVSGGFGVSDTEVDDYIQEQLTEFGNTNNIQDTQNMYEESSIDFADTFYSNFKYYKQELSIAKYLKDSGADMQLDYANYKAKKEKLTGYAVTSYKKTSAYGELMTEIMEMKPVLMNNEDILKTARGHMKDWRQ